MTNEGSLELETTQRQFTARRISPLDLAELRILWARGCACGRPTRRVIGTPRRAVCAQCSQAADVDRSIARQREEAASMCRQR